MIEIEGTTYYSMDEIKFAQLHHYISLSITDNSNNHLLKASLYFDSTMRIESVASSTKYKNGFIHLKGIFNISIENKGASNDAFLLLYLTKHSLINGEQANNFEPIRIKPNEIIFNYINFPEIYSTMLRNTDKPEKFYTFLPRYFTKSDIKKILKISRYTKTNPNNLIKEIDLFKLEKEFKPANKYWYETISNNSEHFCINYFENESFITLELLKDYLSESNFLKIINLAESRLLQLYFHIDTKDRFFNFETKSKHFKLINNQFSIKGFLIFKKSTKTKMDFQAHKFCFIKNIIPNENPFCFSTYEFENLVEFVNIKNNFKIEKTYIDIMDSIIENSILHTQDVYIYFNLNELAMVCEDYDINLKEEHVLKQYKSREIINLQQTNKKQSIELASKNPIQTQSIINFIIVELKKIKGRKSNNRLIILSALQKYIEQYPQKKDLPDFGVLFDFIKKEGGNIDLIYDVEPNKIFLMVEKHITRTAFQKAFKKLLQLFNSTFDH